LEEGELESVTDLLRQLVSTTRDRLAALRATAPRLALVVEASTPRRDVRHTRASLLLLLLSLRCPLHGRPRRSWYVRGAVARLSPAALERAWESFHGEAPPCERTLRAHLRALEEHLAIIRAPGELVPTLHDEAHRPRYPDTIHVLEEDRDARWWAAEGRALLERHPEVRRSAAAWRALFEGWREQARAEQLELFDTRSRPVRRHPSSGGEATPADRAAWGGAVAGALELGPLELLAVLARAGAPLSAKGQLEALRQPARLRQAAALYALALRRGDRIRSGSGWLVYALRRAKDAEGRAALASILRRSGTGPGREGTGARGEIRGALSVAPPGGPPKGSTPLLSALHPMPERPSP
jgi:hypothetical protein